MKSMIFKRVALGVLTALGSLALCQCNNTVASSGASDDIGKHASSSSSSISSSESTQYGPTYTVKVAASDFQVTSGGVGSSIEEDGFTIGLDNFEIKDGKIQLAASTSRMIFPTFNRTAHPNCHYISLVFVGLYDPMNTMQIKETDTAGNEKVLVTDLREWTAVYDSDMVGSEIVNQGLGSLLFTSVTVKFYL